MRSASAMALRHLAKPLPRGLSEVLWSPRSVPEMNARARGVRRSAARFRLLR